MDEERIPVGRAEDLTGRKFGRLTVLYRVKNNRHYGKGAVWHCICDCGNECNIRANSLKTGDTKSCGCLQKEHIQKLGKSFLNDLTGKKFGRLLVIERDISFTNRPYWKCKCDCGNIVSVCGESLTLGVTRSCGCLMRENSKRLGESTIIDISGQRFGKLTVLERVIMKDGRKDKKSYWKCRCDCGGTVIASKGNLIQGGVSSCGCLRSKGENAIVELLKANHIDFVREKSFKDCCSSITGYPLRFDFYVDNKYLIEFDGKQHFTYGNDGWNTEEHFKKVQIRDKIKNQWCKENNIPLIRIPYTHLKDLCIEDLLLETSQFILKL